MIAGDRVRVRWGELDDEHGDAARCGHAGVVVGRIVNDHGASARDPLLVVRFADGERDAFWETELEVLQ